MPKKKEILYICWLALVLCLMVIASTSDQRQSYLASQGYRVMETIDSGAFANIYLAEKRNMLKFIKNKKQKYVAIKRINRSVHGNRKFLVKFLPREVATHSSVSHQNGKFRKSKKFSHSNFSILSFYFIYRSVLRRHGNRSRYLLRVRVRTERKSFRLLPLTWCHQRGLGLSHYMSAGGSNKLSAFELHHSQRY